MTLFAYLDGADLGYRVRLNGFGLSSRADGSLGIGGIVFDDSDATLTVRGWQSIVVRETACTAAPTLFTGFIADRNYSRKGEAEYRTGTARWIDTNLIDQNAVLHFRLITDSDGKRPEELISARISWLLNSAYMTGFISDTSLVDSTDPVPFGEADYRGQYADDVLQDLAGPIAKLFFVYPTQTLGARGLFFNTPTATTSTSTLTLSNVLSDVDNATCFPAGNVVLNRDPSEVYSLGRFTYANGTVLDANGTGLTTRTTYFDGNSLGNRGIQVENSRVGRMATARSWLVNILTRDAAERDTITLTTILPAAKAGLIAAGQRVQVRFTHLPGYETARYVRVTARTIRQAQGTPDFYELDLELSNGGLSSTGGGGAPGPGVFPTQPSGPPSLVQHKLVTTTGAAAPSITLDAVPGLGGLLIWSQVWRETATPITTPTGFTQVGSTVDLNISGGDDCLVLFYRISQSGDTATFSCTGSGSKDTVIELSEWLGSWDSASLVNTSGVGSGAGLSASVTVTPTASKSAIVYGALGDRNVNAPGDPSFAAGTGYTLLNTSQTPTGHPLLGAVYKIVASTTGSYSPNGVATAGSFGGATSFWGEVAAVFVQNGDQAAVPIPGQPVGPETVTMVGASGTTANPFATGSLRVYVDLLDQTAAVTTQNAALGTFTLGFTPKTGEVVTVTYLGR